MSESTPAPAPEAAPLVPPVPKGPVLVPPIAPRHAFYSVHTPITLPDGTFYDKGAILDGAEALAYEVAVAHGQAMPGAAVPHGRDPRVG